MMQRCAILLALCAILVSAPAAWAEVSRVRVGRGPGFSFLPIYLMENGALIEKHARQAGLGEVTAEFPEFTGGSMMNDALLSGNMEFVNGGVPPYLILWSRTLGTRREIKALGAVSGGPSILFSRDPAVQSIRDFTETSRISVAAVRASQVAILLQMAAEQAFGPGEWSRLDPLTVSMPQPESVAMMTAAQPMDITAHFTVPPYTRTLQRDPRIRPILHSKDVLGGLGTVVVSYASTQFHAENPRIVAAYRAALAEAAQLIKEQPRRAAEIYKGMARDPLPLDDLEAMIRDPDMDYGLTPAKTMLFADFMGRIGSLPKRPSGWKDLFFPEIHHLPGS